MIDDHQIVPCRRSPLRHALIALIASLLVVIGATQRPATATELDELVVVVSERSDVMRMSAREIRKLFLGKSRKLPDGSRATIARFEPADTVFNERALQRSDAEVTAAWARLQFSGRVRAPHAFGSVEDIAAFVAATPSAIGYLPAGEGLPAGVRAVFAVPR